MDDRIFLSASPNNLEACIELANSHGLGIELMAFAYPKVLDGDWRGAVARYQQVLRPVRGGITLHGPFFDMSPGSVDPLVNALVTQRYRQALQIASELRGLLVVFHANFIASMHNDEYRTGWQSRNIDFWGGLAHEAQALGVKIAIENMWEYDPDIIGDVVKQIDHPYVRACLDVGHAKLFSPVPFEKWLRALDGYLMHAHLNNNAGVVDVHQSLMTGALDYTRILPMLRELPTPPSFTLEMDSVEDMRASLELFDYDSTPVWKRSTIETKRASAEVRAARSDGG